MSEKKVEKKDIGSIVFVIFIFATCFACGYLIGEYIGKAAKNGEGFFVTMALFLIAISAAIYIQTIVHEAGHLVFGLLTGYKFSSFRIGSLMLVKADGKLKLRKFSLAGTGGQCLMSPPDLVDGKMPIVLYNLGGCIFNLLAAGIFVIIGYFAQGIEILYVFSSCMVIMGVVYAVSNGIPMKVGPINNDGGNAFSVGKNPAAIRALWLQLKMNELQSKGMRLKDMPENWFEVPSDEGLKNEMVAAIAVFRANWLMDQLRLEEAAEYMETLLVKENAICGLYRSLLNCDRIYCELVVKKNTSEAIYLHNKDYQKFVKSMKTFPSIIRTEYVYALLAEKDEEKAAEWLKRFEKVAKTHPYPNDIVGERELIELVGDN